jgi:glutamyl-tRNA synthetase
VHTLFESEFEETILEDLNLLDIKGDIVTHTSDYFDQIYELAVKIIKTGKAYADDTEQAQVAFSCLRRQTYWLMKATDA